MIRKVKIILLALSLSFLSTTCETSSFHIPYAIVDLHLNIISELGNPALNSIIEMDGGVNGLLVFREDYDLFHVYDRTCTNYPDHNARIKPDSTFAGAYSCPECKSLFFIDISLKGEPISGTASFSLHEYYSRVDGDILHIYN